MKTLLLTTIFCAIATTANATGNGHIGITNTDVLDIERKLESPKKKHMRHDMGDSAQRSLSKDLDEVYRKRKRAEREKANKENSQTNRARRRLA